MKNSRRLQMGGVAKYLLLLLLVFCMMQCNTMDRETRKRLADGDEAEDRVTVKFTPPVISAYTDDEDDNVGDEVEDRVYTIAAVMPKFIGGDEAMMKYISENLKYPNDAEKDGIQGRVTLRFVVEKNGEITNIEVTRGVYKSCDAEAVRIVKSMPKWKPAEQSGKAVRVYYTLPIAFRL